jgi:hypothetical protein
MAPWWEKADIVGKILLGLAGLCLSVSLAWIEWQDRKQEKARKANEDLRAGEEARAREFQVYYAMARGAQPNDEFVRSDVDLAGAIAQTLAAKPYEKEFYNEAVLALRARFGTPPGTADGPGSETGLTLQANEAATSPAVARSSDEWFAVIASYPLNEQGHSLAVARMRAASALGCVSVWQTKVSQHYAVVVGGKLNRPNALANAQRARRQGIAPDAFTQANREWVQMVPCR